MNRFEDFARESYAWEVATFPTSDPVGIARHLALEADEIAAAPHDILEWADALILVLNGVQRAGFSVDELLSAAEAKLALNKLRKWKAPDADGVIEHVD